ncbi:hypothetical protein AGRO_2135 [Agrobacterium sp. ATCC 31749]|nr:hypothetical protein AGRO_2135 [Agrobacterium sp. ATCC 31749]
MPRMTLTLDRPNRMPEKPVDRPIRAARFANEVLDAPDAGESGVAVGHGLRDK